MVTINTVSEKYFSINGINYAKIYQPLRQGESSVGLFNVFDTRQQLNSSENFNNYQINGVVYPTIEETIEKLLSVVYEDLRVSDFLLINNGKLDKGLFEGTAEELNDLIIDLERQVASISTGEGGKKFDSIQDMRAQDPFPSDYTVAEVNNEGVQEYHIYLNSENGGTRFYREVGVVSFGVKSSLNLALPERIVQGLGVGSNGLKFNGEGWVSLVLPVVEGQVVSLGNYEIDTTGHSSFYLGNLFVSYQGHVTTASLPRVLTVPAGVDTFVLNIARPTNDVSDYGLIMVNEGGVLLPYEEAVEFVDVVSGREVLAKKLASGNFVPDPLEKGNAVNKGYFDNNAIVNEDLGLLKSLNLGVLSDVIEGFYINSSGGKSTGDGWKTLKIDVSDVESISFGNISIDVAGFSAFYKVVDGVESLSLYNGNYTDSTLPKSYNVPEAAKYLYVTIARPTNDVSDYGLIMVNEGGVLLPYESPEDVVVSIKGKKIEGGIEEGGDVSFGTVNVKGLVVDLLEGDGVRPSELPANANGMRYAWFDTSTNLVRYD